MTRLFGAVLAAGLMFAGAAQADGPARVRGQLVSFNATQLVVETAQHEQITVAMDPKTRFALSHPATLSAVQPGGFVGIATKDVAGKEIALEVTIFPPAMRGAGEGHYPWDKLPDTTAPGGMAHSSMTNGAVSMAMPAPEVTTSMTNGNVNLANAAGGGKILVLSYKGGTQRIFVPAKAPVVALSPADASALTVGDYVFVVALPGPNGLTAAFVNEGADGLKLHN
jgi:hypothetical protein